MEYLNKPKTQEPKTEEIEKFLKYLELVETNLKSFKEFLQKLKPNNNNRPFSGSFHTNNFSKNPLETEKKPEQRQDNSYRQHLSQTLEKLLKDYKFLKEKKPEEIFNQLFKIELIDKKRIRLDLESFGFPVLYISAIDSLKIERNTGKMLENTDIFYYRHEKKDLPIIVCNQDTIIDIKEQLNFEQKVYIVLYFLIKKFPVKSEKLQELRECTENYNNYRSLTEFVFKNCQENPEFSELIEICFTDIQSSYFTDIHSFILSHFVYKDEVYKYFQSYIKYIIDLTFFEKYEDIFLDQNFQLAFPDNFSLLFTKNGDSDQETQELVDFQKTIIEYFKSELLAPNTNYSLDFKEFKKFISAGKNLVNNILKTIFKQVKLLILSKMSFYLYLHSDIQYLYLTDIQKDLKLFELDIQEYLKRFIDYYINFDKFMISVKTYVVDCLNNYYNSLGDGNYNIVSEHSEHSGYIAIIEKKLLENLKKIFKQTLTEFCTSEINRYLKIYEKLIHLSKNNQTDQDSINSEIISFYFSLPLSIFDHFDI